MSAKSRSPEELKDELDNRIKRLDEIVAQLNKPDESAKTRTSLEKKQRSLEEGIIKLLLRLNKTKINMTDLIKNLAKKYPVLVHNYQQNSLKEFQTKMSNIQKRDALPTEKYLESMYKGGQSKKTTSKSKSKK